MSPWRSNRVRAALAGALCIFVYQCLVLPDLIEPFWRFNESTMRIDGITVTIEDIHVSDDGDGTLSYLMTKTNPLREIRPRLSFSIDYFDEKMGFISSESHIPRMNFGFFEGISTSMAGKLDLKVPATAAYASIDYRGGGWLVSGLKRIRRE